MPGAAVVTEANTCRKFVVPRLQTAGWEGAPHAINEQRTFTDCRVIFVGGKPRRGRQKRADYILRYRTDYPIVFQHAILGLTQIWCNSHYVAPISLA